jgi:ribonucleoside-diphosphate reductase alpha subunit
LGNWKNKMPPPEANVSLSASPESNKEVVWPFAVPKHVHLQPLLSKLRSGMDPDERNTFLANAACELSAEHPDWNLFAGQCLMQQLHRSTRNTFSACVEQLATAPCDCGSQSCNHSRLDKETYLPFVRRHAERLDKMIDPTRDWRFDFQAVSTWLRGGYLLEIQKRAVERPQYALLREAVYKYTKSARHRFPWHDRSDWSVIGLGFLLAVLFMLVDPTRTSRSVAFWTLQMAGLPPVMRNALWAWMLLVHGLAWTLFCAWAHWSVVPFLVQQSRHHRVCGYLLFGLDLFSCLVPRPEIDEWLLQDIQASYNASSQWRHSSATPTRLYSGMARGQLSSCFLQSEQGDSLEDINATTNEYSMISRGGGGGCIDSTCIRARGMFIHSTAGHSNGLPAMLRVREAVAQYVDQGGGKRKGALCISIQPWHADILETIKMRRNNGCSLFFAVFANDLLYERVRSNGRWTFFCPTKAPGLIEATGSEFKRLYESYEQRPECVYHSMAALTFLELIAAEVIESGIFVNHKEIMTRRCNQRNLGTIRCSNLCQEITEWSGQVPASRLSWWRRWFAPVVHETAVCNLASIPLEQFLLPGPASIHDPVVENRPSAAFLRALEEERQGATVDVAEVGVPAAQRRKLSLAGIPEEERERFHVDFRGLFLAAAHSVRELNAVLDATTNPTEGTRRSNAAHRPVGLGVLGLASQLARLAAAFGGPVSRVLNVEMFEAIQFGAWTSSNELAQRDGAYSSFRGSPASEGKFQHDLALEDEAANLCEPRTLHTSGRWDWDGLRAKVVRFGVRNSLLTAVMPTVSTGPLTGNPSPCIEPPRKLVMRMSNKSGEYVQWFHPFVETVERLGYGHVLSKVREQGGSAQSLMALPEWVRAVYRTFGEVPAMALQDMAADRGQFIDQSQSLNLPIIDTSPSAVARLLLRGHKLALKCSIYYADPQRASNTQNLATTIVSTPKKMVAEEQKTCSRTDREGCTACQ